MKDVLVIYNYAQNYRSAIFQLIDKSWNCRWMFGVNTTDIKGMSTDLLKNVTYVDNISIFKSIYFQKGTFKESLKKQYDTLIVLGEPFNLSTWLILLFNKINRHKKDIILWSHGWYGRESKLKKFIKNIFFNLGDKIMLYGKYAKQVAIQQGFPESKLEVIHNSLDYGHQLKLRKGLKKTSEYLNHFNNYHPVIIFIGRLTKVKRLDILLDALEILKNQGINLNLTLIGDGEAREELENMVRQKNLGSNVWFFGASYNEAENAQLIFDADLCVSPGNVGLTAIHAMMFGCPVITHNNYSMQMPEFEAIKEGLTGGFFEYNDRISLAESINKWFVEHSRDRKQIREACYAEIDNYWTPKYQLGIIQSIEKKI